MSELIEAGKRTAKRLFQQAPYTVRRRLPDITLEPFDLLSALFQARNEPMTIMQVGACDGITNDPIHAHATRATARCVLLEPNPYAFQRLQQTYKGAPNVTLVQAAIAETDGELPLYRVKRSRPDSGTDTSLQVASFYRDHLLKHHVAPQDIEQITVPCRSLASLMKEFAIGTIDLLQIDTEGFDATVVRMALDLPAPPNVINFEHVHLRATDRQPLFDRLAAADYLLGHGLMDCTAVQRSFMDRVRGTAQQTPAEPAFTLQ